MVISLAPILKNKGIFCNHKINYIFINNILNNSIFSIKISAKVCITPQPIILDTILHKRESIKHKQWAIFTFFIVLLCVAMR